MDASPADGNNSRIKTNVPGAFRSKNRISDTKVNREQSHITSAQTQVKVTPFEVNMELSLQEFSSHVKQCNNDFRENIMRKVQTIKLKDTSELNKIVDELKIQETQELQSLKKVYSEIDAKYKKLEAKVSPRNF